METLKLKAMIEKYEMKKGNGNKKGKNQIWSTQVLLPNSLDFGLTEWHKQIAS